MLAERGYRGTSMLEVARRARASKETLYAWFGDKRGLFAALIAANAERLAAALDATGAPPPEAPEARLRVLAEAPAMRLRTLAEALLALLLGGRALVVNRAAIAEAAAGDTGFAELLAREGRERFAPRIAAALAAARDAGLIAYDDPSEAVEDFLGLLLGDRQVRRLLGLLPEPGPEEIRARAARAVACFIRAYAPAASPAPDP